MSVGGQVELLLFLFGFVHVVFSDMIANLESAQSLFDARSTIWAWRAFSLLLTANIS